MTVLFIVQFNLGFTIDSQNPSIVEQQSDKERIKQL